MTELRKNTMSGWEKASYYAFHLLVFLIPLTIFPFSYDNFDLPKTVLFRALLVFIFACWLVGRLISGRITVRRSQLSVFVLTFVGAALLATLVSVDFATSLWGKYERYEGFLTLLTYGGLFFLTIQLFWEARRVKALVDTMAAAVALVSLYALIQYFGLDPITWGEQAFEAKRAASTFGNPIFLAGYLALVFPVLLVRFQEEERAYRLAFLSLAILTACAALLVTFSRGGWIAFVAGSVFLAAVQGKRIVNKRMMVLTVFLAAIIVSVTVMTYVGSLRKPGEPSVPERLASTLDAGGGSTATRLLIWKSALEIIRDRPWLGHGPDSFHLSYGPRGSLRYAQLVERGNQPDNAHNYMLQLGSTTGLVGLWAFVSLLIFVIWQGAGKILKEPDDRRLLLGGLFAGLIAYLIHLQFSINVIDSGFMFWLFLGLLWSPFSREISVQRKVLLTSGTGFLLFALVVLVLSLRFFTADMRFLRAEESVSMGSFDLAANEYKKAVELNPYQTLYLLSLGKLYGDAALEMRDQELFVLAKNTYLEAQKKNPLEPDNYLFLGDLFLRAAPFNSRYYRLAERELTEALRIYPFGADEHALLGKLYFEIGRSEAAEFHFETLSSIDPTDKTAYSYLANIYRGTGRPEEAYRAYTEVLKRDPANSEATKALQELAATAGAAVTRAQ